MGQRGGVREIVHGRHLHARDLDELPEYQPPDPSQPIDGHPLHDNPQTFSSTDPAAPCLNKTRRRVGFQGKGSCSFSWRCSRGGGGWAGPRASWPGCCGGCPVPGRRRCGCPRGRPAPPPGTAARTPAAPTPGECPHAPFRLRAFAAFRASQLLQKPYREIEGSTALPRGKGLMIICTRSTGCGEVCGMPVQAMGGNVRKTKLVMTLGPALMQGDRLREALKEADAVRLNASHGDPETRAEGLRQVRDLALELGRFIPVFLDLQGPKWRIGLLDTPLDLAAGSEGVFYPSDTPAPTGYAWAAPLPHPELFEGAEVG